MRARLGWLLFAATALCAVAETWFVAALRPLLSEETYLDGWPLISFAAVGGTLMAALVISRYPRHPIGWLLGVGELGTAVGLCAEAFGSWALTAEPSWSAVGLLGIWVGALLGTPYGVALVTALFLLVPDGHLPSRRWRVVLPVTGVGFALHVVALLALGPDGLRGEPSDVAPWVVAADTGASVVLLGTLVAAAVALTRRTRAARGLRRQQLRWVAASAVALALGLLVGVGGLLVLELAAGRFQAVGGLPTALVTPLFLGYAAVPVCTGIAVLRYRLLDVDVVINRAVLLATATALVTVLYVAAVLAIGGLLGPSDGGLGRSLAATAVAALAFQPLRRRVVTFANRLAYGRRTAPYEALAGLSDRATASPTSDGLLAAVASAVGEAVAARRVTVALTPAVGGPVVAEWRPPQPTRPRPAPPAPARRGPGTRFDVVDPGGALGWVDVEVPPGRTLTRAEHRLLRDLADAAAVAFRNARLEVEAADHLQVLARRTAALERSRRRLIRAQDDERRRLERAVHRTVLPALDGLPADLEAAATAVRAGAVPDVEPLLARTTAALEALRDLGHGLRVDATSVASAGTSTDDEGAEDDEDDEGTGTGADGAPAAGAVGVAGRADQAATSRSGDSWSLGR